MSSSWIRFLVSFLFIALAISTAEAQPAGPVIDASMSDGLQVDGDMDGMADPGDTLRYTVDISNTGDATAGNALFSDTIDANTTLLGGSVFTTPIARNDSYDSIGNVGINVPAGAGVLANDNDPDGGAVMVTAFDASSVNAGNVFVAADGGFTYAPPPGFEGIDTFTYSVMDDEGQADMATVTVSVSEMIWFVDASAMCPCDGRRNTPFNDLAVGPNSFDVNAADDTGDNIFVADGNYNGGLTLLTSQRLIGDGSSSTLAAITGIVLPPHSVALPAFSGTDPVITSAAGNGITVGSGNTIRGLTVGNTPTGIGIADGGATVGALAISESSIEGTGNGIRVANGGALDVTLTSVSASGASFGIHLQNTTGSFTVTGAGGLCTAATPTCSGGRIQNMAGADGAVAGNGVYLNNATNVSLNLMRLNDQANYGVFGDTVTGFNLTNSLVDGGNGSAAFEGSIRFTNLLGSANITACDISGARGTNVEITNTLGVLNRLTMANTIIGPNDPVFGNFGFLLAAAGTSTANVTLNNNTFTSARTTLIALQAQNTAAADFVVTNNTLSNNHPAIQNGSSSIVLATVNAADVTYRVSGNVMRDAANSAIRVILDTTDAGATMVGTIENNEIGVSGVVHSGSTMANGIEVRSIGAATHTTLINNNTVLRARQHGILLWSREGAGALHATVTNNLIDQPSADAPSYYGLLAQAGVAAPDTNLLCANITGNNLGSAAPLGEFDFFLAQVGASTVNLPGYMGGALDVAAAAAFVAGNNPTGLPLGGAFAAGPNGFQNAPCITPPMAPIAARNPAPVPETDSELLAANSAMAYSIEPVPPFHGAVAEVRSSSLIAAGPAGIDAPQSGETVMLGLGDLDPGQQVTITFDVTVDSPFLSEVLEVCNQGTVTGDNFAAELTDDPDVGGTDDPTCTLIDEPEADLNITKTDSADPALAGNALTYTVTVNNAGPDAATNVVVIDTLPAGVSFVSTTGCAEDPNGVPSCSLGTIASGGSAMYAIAVTVDVETEGTITNTASVAADTEDPNPEDNSTSEDTEVLAGADLSITKMDTPDPAVAGDSLTYTIEVSNAGPADATNVVVTDNLPPGLTLVSTAGCAEDPNGIPTCSLGTILAGGSAMFTVTTNVDAALEDGAVLNNIASVTSETNDPVPGNNTASAETLVGREIDIVVTKTDSPDPVVAGLEIGGLEYVITVTNNGPSDGDAVVINDPAAALPAGVTVDSWVESAGTYDGTNWVVDLPDGAMETLTLTVTVGPTAPTGPDALSNTAAVTGSGGGETLINTADDSATATTTVNPTTATWRVMKDFLDDSGASVTMSLSCTSGTVSSPVQVSEGNPQSLTVEGFLQGPFGSTTCTVSESNLPEGYYEVSSTEDCQIVGVAHEAEYLGCTFVNAPIQATFHVTKDFTDDNPANVRVAIECNTGLPLQQHAMISEFGDPFDHVDFIVGDFQVGTLDCDVFEEPVPAGYAQSYAASDNPDAIYGGLSQDGDGCHFEAIETGTFDCAVTNTLLPVDVTVNKEWIDEHPEYQGSQVVNITLRCDNGDIVYGYGCGSDECIDEYIDPDNPGLFEVFPEWDGSTECSVTEAPEVGVDQDVSDCAGIELAPGVDGECTIVNTRLYAGIPTLSQYGLALLALLMLAMGAVAFRRGV